MSTRTDHPAHQDATPSAPDMERPSESNPKRKRTARRKNPTPTYPATDRNRAAGSQGFKVPMGNSGESFESVWFFGG